MFLHGVFSVLTVYDEFGGHRIVKRNDRIALIQKAVEAHAVSAGNTQVFN